MMQPAPNVGADVHRGLRHDDGARSKLRSWTDLGRVRDDGRHLKTRLCYSFKPLRSKRVVTEGDDRMGEDGGMFGEVRTGSHDPPRIVVRIDGVVEKGDHGPVARLLRHIGDHPAVSAGTNDQKPVVAHVFPVNLLIVACPD